MLALQVILHYRRPFAVLLDIRSELGGKVIVQQSQV
jgi:hypothetical protein